MRTFSGHSCDLMGVGVFPLVALDDLRVHSFHCPATAGWSGASTNVGVALRVGTDTVVLRGTSLVINGQATTSSVGAINVLTYGSTFEINVGSLKLVSTTFATSNIPTGYFQNVRVSVPTQASGAGSAASICGVQSSQNNLIPRVASTEGIFSSTDVSELQAICGTPGVGPQACGPSPPACTVCAQVGIDCQVARSACEAACSCGGVSAIENCMFDYCAMGGDATAGEACAEANECDMSPSPSPPRTSSRGHRAQGQSIPRPCAHLRRARR